MLSQLVRSTTLRASTAASVAVVLFATVMSQPSSADLSSQISTAKSAAGALRAQISADSAQIAQTADGVQRAQERLDAVQSRLDGRVAELKQVQTSLLDARDRLVYVENHLHAATQALSTNLVANYEGQQPSLVNVVLSANGFNQLLEQVSFAQKVARQDADIVSTARQARIEVSAEARRLQTLEQRDRTLADQVLDQRNQAAALQSALSAQQIKEQARRAQASGQYGQLRSHLASLQHQLNVQERKAAQAAVAAAQTGNANVNGIAIDTGGMVQAPAGAPEAVRQMIAAGNAIATLPYIYGGGHASFQADGYDCSGSVSYVLAAAGLVTSPMVSGDFDGWGDPGPGRWVTIYSNADHVWMTIAGWRYDTVALAETGTRWAQGGGEFAGFDVEHPPGL